MADPIGFYVYFYNFDQYAFDTWVILLDEHSNVLESVYYDGSKEEDYVVFNYEFQPNTTYKIDMRDNAFIGGSTTFTYYTDPFHLKYFFVKIKLPYIDPDDPDAEWPDEDDVIVGESYLDSIYTFTTDGNGVPNQTMFDYNVYPNYSSIFHWEDAQKIFQTYRNLTYQNISGPLQSVSYPNIWSTLNETYMRLYVDNHETNFWTQMVESIILPSSRAPILIITNTSNYYTSKSSYEQDVYPHRYDYVYRGIMFTANPPNDGKCVGNYCFKYHMDENVSTRRVFEEVKISDYPGLTTDKYAFHVGGTARVYYNGSEWVFDHYANTLYAFEGSNFRGFYPTMGVFRSSPYYSTNDGDYAIIGSRTRFYDNDIRVWNGYTGSQIHILDSKTLQPKLFPGFLTTFYELLRGIKWSNGSWFKGLTPKKTVITSSPYEYQLDDLSDVIIIGDFLTEINEYGYAYFIKQKSLLEVTKEFYATTNEDDVKILYNVSSDAYIDEIENNNEKLKVQRDIPKIGVVKDTNIRLDDNFKQNPLSSIVGADGCIYYYSGANLIKFNHITKKYSLIGTFDSAEATFQRCAYLSPNGNIFFYLYHSQSASDYSQLKNFNIRCYELNIKTGILSNLFRVTTENPYELEDWFPVDPKNLTENDPTHIYNDISNAKLESTPTVVYEYDYNYERLHTFTNTIRRDGHIGKNGNLFVFISLQARLYYDSYRQENGITYHYISTGSYTKYFRIMYLAEINMVTHTAVKTMKIPYRDGIRVGILANGNVAWAGGVRRQEIGYYTSGGYGNSYAEAPTKIIEYNPSNEEFIINEVGDVLPMTHIKPRFDRTGGFVLDQFNYFKADQGVTTLAYPNGLLSNFN